MENAPSVSEKWNQTYASLTDAMKVVSSVLKETDRVFGDISPVHTVPPELRVQFTAGLATSFRVEHTRMGEPLLYINVAIGRPIDMRELSIHAAVWACDAAHGFVGTVVHDVGFLAKQWPGRADALRAVSAPRDLDYLAQFDLAGFLQRVNLWLRRVIQDGVEAADSDDHDCAVGGSGG